MAAIRNADSEFCHSIIFCKKKTTSKSSWHKTKSKNYLPGAAIFRVPMTWNVEKSEGGMSPLQINCKMAPFESLGKLLAMFKFNKIGSNH